MEGEGSSSLEPTAEQRCVMVIYMWNTKNAIKTLTSRSEPGCPWCYIAPCMPRDTETPDPGPPASRHDSLVTPLPHLPGFGLDPRIHSSRQQRDAPCNFESRSALCCMLQTTFRRKQRSCEWAVGAREREYGEGVTFQAVHRKMHSRLVRLAYGANALKCQ